MSNKNYLSHDYQLPDDSFLYNLDVNDWSMLAHPEETDQPDDDRGVGGEPRQFDQEQQSEPEAKVAIEPTRTKDEGEMVGATETLEVKAVPGLAREQVIAEVALAGQVGQTAREEEKANIPWIELEEAEERAMELREQKANLNAVVLFVVMLALMESQEQEANSDKPHVERLVDDPDWQELGERTGNKVRAEMMEMCASAAHNKYLRSSDGSKRDIKQERALATKRADDAYGLVKQLYANPGWSPDELLQKELLRLDIEESPDKARLAETLDTVHDLFGVGRDGHSGNVAPHDISRIAQHDLPRDGLSDLEQYFAEHDELKDSGCVGAIALYHLRKNPNGDESIKKILQLTEGGSDVAEVADDYYDVAEYDQKLKLIDEMVDQIDQYFDKAGVEDPYRCFTAKRLGRFGGKGNMLYRWVSTCSSEYETMRLSEDRLRQITEKHASFGGVCRYIEWKWKKGLCEKASEIKRGETKRRRNRSSQRTCAE
ncbi:MAG: hypothetical protein ACFNVL_00080 [Candidatus Nanoperiomorbus sp.]